MSSACSERSSGWSYREGKLAPRGFSAAGPGDWAERGRQLIE